VHVMRVMRKDTRQISARSVYLRSFRARTSKYLRHTALHTWRLLYKLGGVLLTL
jgi:hypothetical protein